MTAIFILAVSAKDEKGGNDEKHEDEIPVLKGIKDSVKEDPLSELEG